MADAALGRVGRGVHGVSPCRRVVGAELLAGGIGDDPAPRDAGLYHLFPSRRGQVLSWELRSNPDYTLPPGEQADLLRSLRLIRVVRGKSVALPHWVLMLACAVVGAAPWLRWRFSVRGVLVLMAFIAAMFAILVFE
jgi:hypothetical protein